MQPIGLLMKEHRLIERMITLLEMELQQSKKSLIINTELITLAIDFFRTYADRTHHGKEEDILFKTLSKMKLSEELRRTMNQLLEDHQTSREVINALEDANLRYIQGYHASIHEIHKKLLQLITLYPQHIEIEDTQFFFPVMDYFTSNERDAMLQEFIDFDKNIIHEHYSDLVEKQEKKDIHEYIKEGCIINIKNLSKER